ncbi:MAG TPA: hypothetical protein VHH88_08910 [Verrucomicrobiae bacterium]|nr:hypothetical protein [Verrucomicrobiae bacterium]
MRIFRKVIVFSLIAVFFTILLADTWLHVSYATLLPDKPNLGTNQTNRVVVNHGFVRFANDRELHKLRAAENAWPFAFLVFGTALIIVMRHKHEFWPDKRLAAEDC